MASSRSSHDHVVHRCKTIAPQAKGLAYAAAYTIAIDRLVRHSARHGHAETRLVGRNEVHPEEFVTAGATTGKNRLELRTAEQACSSGQALPPWHLPADYRPGLAARRLRPLARRALMIARPDLVAMRARKPWRRRRLILLGWNVRFMTESVSCWCFGDGFDDRMAGRFAPAPVLPRPRHHASVNATPLRKA